MYLSGKIYAVESERFEFAIHNGLDLKNRSLVFSIVQLYDGYHSTKYYCLYNGVKTLAFQAKPLG